MATVERHKGPVSSGVRRAFILIGIVSAELPDIDLVYAGAALGMGKLGYLLHHRGHTHTVPFALAGAVLTWLAGWGFRRDLRPPEVARALFWLSLAGTVSHLALDWTNSYGVHPFWPFDNRWYFGDAVFIVEPWLWIAALGPLLFLAREWSARVVFTFLLLAILGATWGLGMVPRSVATVITVGALAWPLACRAASPAHRVRLGIVAWLVVEAGFFAARGAGRRAVAREVGPSLKDVVLTPSPGDPTCLQAMAVSVRDGMYTVTTATVATLPGLRSALACGGASRGGLTGAPSQRPSSRGIAWHQTWEAPVAELRELGRTHCEVAAALRYLRVPVWRRVPGGSIELSDARYGEGGASFASLTLPEVPGTCPWLIPPWTPPRQDVLGPVMEP